jgi:hypothetical protein
MSQLTFKFFFIYVGLIKNKLTSDKYSRKYVILIPCHGLMSLKMLLVSLDVECKTVFSYKNEPKYRQRQIRDEDRKCKRYLR